MQNPESKTLVLASQSPRRKQLLEQIGFEFVVDPSSFEEVMDPQVEASELVKILSEGKAKDVSSRHSNAIIIACDTFLVKDNKYFGKPKNEAEALKLLLSFSGNSHQVISGYTIIDTVTGKTVSESVSTKITLRTITEHEARAYVSTSEPLDAAGAYKIQGKGGIFVEKIEGDYYNVVGLPLCALVESLKEFNIYPF